MSRYLVPADDEDTAFEVFTRWWEARGIALMDSACAAGAGVGCALRAATYAHMGDLEAGKASLAQACELDAASCEQFSKQFEAAKSAK